MLFHHLRDSASGVDIEQMVAVFDEDVDANALRNAWAALIDQHEALRTTFEWRGSGAPEQVVHRHVPLDWIEEDWRTLAADDQGSRFENFLRDDRRRGFDLRVAPLMRFALFLCGDRPARFVWTFHHILTDGQSFPALIRSAFDAYDVRRHGHASAPSAPPPRYRTFIDWHQRHRAADAETFWREALAGFSAPTPLPSATAGSATPAWDERMCRLSGESTQQLRTWVESIGVTLPTAIEAAWALVLATHSGEDDVVFGVTRACRRATVPGAEDIVGSFINTLPVRVAIDHDQIVTDWLLERRAASRRLRAFEHTSLLDIQKWSDIPSGQPLFESILIYTPRLVGALLSELGGHWSKRHISFHEQTNFPLALFAYGERELLLKLAYDRERISPSTIARCLRELHTILSALPDHAARRVGDCSVLAPDEAHQLLATWNDTERPFDATCIHHLFEQQVDRSPDATALVFRNHSCTFDELNRRANRLAVQLIAHGAGPDQMVGIFVDRSIDMVVGLLGILKSGAAYVPLDPSYPSERLAWMLADTSARLVVAQAGLAASLPASTARVVIIDPSPVGDAFANNPSVHVRPDHLAYVIFTSGSSGRPKGVMVEHRNVANFFAGMGDVIAPTTPGVWLAVTSISFDISVLELFWTLTRGFTVVIQEELQKRVGMAPRPRTAASARPMDFSLFYFAADAGEDGASRYRLLLEGAKYADAHDFSAIWTPERHFHQFGGLYPNPAVTSAALAATTNRIAIRAGSVVMPLHDPIRVAEEWAVVDNLSDGRVGLSFASGWHVNDFALKPENYRDRKSVMLAGIDTVRRLWRGEAVPARNGNGEPIEVRIFPAPVQTSPPIWITSAGNIDSFRMAGELGANLLTNLLGQKLEEVALKIAAYREARRQAGHPGEGTVSLMLHTFVGADLDAVRETVRRPFIDYLRTSTELVKQARWEFPAFATPGKRQGSVDHSDLSREEIDAMLDHAFERYFQSSGLFGTPAVCLNMVERLKEAGVDEIACLIDFGVAPEQVLASLEYLNEVREMSNTEAKEAGDYSIAAQLERHNVTHLQCTPSLLRTVLLDTNSADALRDLEVLMLGGEALPPALAADVAPRIQGRLLNMYGPTETTVWSATATVAKDARSVTIGRPIANTQIFLVDRRSKIVPIGASGELLIGGAGVARGYLGRTDLTAEKFVKLPTLSSGNNGGQLYRTGDLARYRDDGQIEFLGRIDHQVKVHGHRIELAEVETALGRNAAVRQSVVIARDASDGQAQLVAYVVPEHPDAPAESRLGVERWQTVWDDAFQQECSIDPTFDISGWTCSYTGDTLPVEEMREWVTHTVARIERFRPRRILEIGCGTGLLLYRLAPKCDEYVGLDISQVVIERLKVSTAHRGLHNVSLHAGAADAVLTSLQGRFDMVVLNSVAQYFPDVDYLVHVLTKAASLATDGGTIFVGDVRHLGLLEAFHTTVELARTAAETGTSDLRHRIRERIDNDAELVIAPQFFHALRRSIPRITNVWIEPKRGRAANELTRFRYDVSLQVGVRRPAADEHVTTLEAPTSLAGLQNALSTADPTTTTVLRGVRLDRPAADLAVAALLARADAPPTAGDLRATTPQPSVGLAIEDVYAVSSAKHYLDFVWPATELDRCDLVIRPAASSIDHVWNALRESGANQPDQPLSALVRQPRLATGRLVQRLKQHLRDTLPGYMVPSAFVMLDALPLTPNGKIDRKALPAPDRQRAESAAAYTPPASELEAIITQIWGELLGLDRVSTTDNFFDLGANSLLMVQAHAALRERLQRSLSLVDLFHFPTVSALAASLAETRDPSVLVDSQARAQARVDAMGRRQNRRSARALAKS